MHAFRQFPTAHTACIFGIKHLCYHLQCRKCSYPVNEANSNLIIIYYNILLKYICNNHLIHFWVSLCGFLTSLHIFIINWFKLAITKAPDPPLPTNTCVHPGGSNCGAHLCYLPEQPAMGSISWTYNTSWCSLKNVMCSSGCLCTNSVHWCWVLVGTSTMVWLLYPKLQIFFQSKNVHFFTFHPVMWMIRSYQS